MSWKDATDILKGCGSKNDDEHDNKPKVNKLDEAFRLEKGVVSACNRVIAGDGPTSFNPVVMKSFSDPVVSRVSNDAVLRKGLDFLGTGTSKETIDTSPFLGDSRKFFQTPSAKPANPANPNTGNLDFLGAGTNKEEIDETPYQNALTTYNRAKTGAEAQARNEARAAQPQVAQPVVAQQKPIPAPEVKPSPSATVSAGDGPVSIARKLGMQYTPELGKKLLSAFPKGMPYPGDTVMVDNNGNFATQRSTPTIKPVERMPGTPKVAAGAKLDTMAGPASLTKPAAGPKPADVSGAFAGAKPEASKTHDIMNMGAGSKPSDPVTPAIRSTVPSRAKTMAEPLTGSTPKPTSVEELRSKAFGSAPTPATKNVTSK